MLIKFFKDNAIILVRKLKEIDTSMENGTYI